MAWDVRILYCEKHGAQSIIVIYTIQQTQQYKVYILYCNNKKSIGEHYLFVNIAISFFQSYVDDDLLFGFSSSMCIVVTTFLTTSLCAASSVRFGYCLLPLVCFLHTGKHMFQYCGRHFYKNCMNIHVFLHVKLSLYCILTTCFWIFDNQRAAARTNRKAPPPGLLETLNRGSSTKRAFISNYVIPFQIKQKRIYPCT